MVHSTLPLQYFISICVCLKLQVNHIIPFRPFWILADFDYFCHQIIAWILLPMGSEWSCMVHSTLPLQYFISICICLKLQVNYIIPFRPFWILADFDYFCHQIIAWILLPMGSERIGMVHSTLPLQYFISICICLKLQVNHIIPFRPFWILADFDYFCHQIIAWNLLPMGSERMGMVHSTLPLQYFISICICLKLQVNHIIPFRPFWILADFDYLCHQIVAWILLPMGSERMGMVRSSIRL